MHKTLFDELRAGASRRLGVITAIALPLAFGCKGCREDGPPGKPEIAAQAITHPTQGDDAKRTARLNGRHLDRGKQYPKSADGSVACGNDVDCFVVQAEKCTPADLDNTLHNAVFGIEQSVVAQYRILGSDGDRCKMTRHVTAITVQLDPKLQAALRKQGKTDDDLANMQADSQAALHKYSPDMVSCVFDMDQALSAALDVAEGKPDPRPWRESCKEIASPGTPASAPAPAGKVAPSKPAENP